MKINAVENYKRYKFFLDFLTRSSKTRFANKYEGTGSIREMSVKSMLLKGYPIFIEEDNGLTLHICFSKQNHYFQNLIDRPGSDIKEDMIMFLEECTKRNFKVSTSTFIPGQERDIFAETKEYRSKVRITKPAPAPKVKPPKPINEGILWIAKEEEEARAKISAKVKEFTKGIVDPFGDGFLDLSPEKENKPAPSTKTVFVKDNSLLSNNQPKVKGIDLSF